jgi:hypothetical protein
MASYCEDKSCEITALRERHGLVLWIVLIINSVMFVVELSAGLVAHPTMPGWFSPVSSSPRGAYSLVCCVTWSISL